MKFMDLWVNPTGSLPADIHDAIYDDHQKLNNDTDKCTSSSL